MADTAISALTEVTAPASTDVVPIVSGGTTKKVTIANLVAAAGVSAGYKQQIMSELDFNVHALLLASSSGLASRTTGAGSNSNTAQNGSFTSTCGTNTTDYAGYELVIGSYSFSWFDMNPKMVIHARPILSTSAGSYVTAYLGVGVRPASATFTIKQFGFKFTTVNGTIAVYATNASGTTETTTDITSQITTPNSVHRFYAEMASGTSIKFYVDGVLVATQTTNLPSGGLADTYLNSMFIHPNASNNQSSSFSVYYHSFSIDAN